MGKLGMHTLKMKILPPDVERTLTVGREAILRVAAYGLAAVCPCVGFSKSRFASFKPQYKQIQTCLIHVTLPGHRHVARSHVVISLRSHRARAATNSSLLSCMPLR